MTVILADQINRRDAVTVSWFGAWAFKQSQFQGGGASLPRRGTPNAGVKLGGGEGMRIGTRKTPVRLVNPL